MGNSKEPVRLRKRMLASGNVSLYLDIYDNGNRQYEYLNLYLVPEKSRADKEKNRETLRLADAIRAQRVVDFRNGKFGFGSGFKEDTLFLDYFRKVTETVKRNKSAGTWNKWDGVRLHLEQICDEGMTFKDADKEFCKRFRRYLDEEACARALKKNCRGHIQGHLMLAHSTKASYFNILRAFFNRAVDEGLIPRSPMAGVKGFKEADPERSYLTLEEVRALAATDCKFPALKRAFLFSCLTGLRKGDIIDLTWGDIRKEGDFTRIVFRQNKTGGQEYLDINPQAEELIGDRAGDTEKVFGDFNYNSYWQQELKRWAALAGIKKDVTFHTGRHTFAVLMLDLGSDVYTVQKLLGHKSINTTQIYAKIMDKKKQEAALLIPPIMPIYKLKE